MKTVKKVQIGNMLILRVKKSNVFDVFTGSGWKNHTRVYFNGRTLTSPEKAHLSKAQLKEIVLCLGGVS